MKIAKKIFRILGTIFLIFLIAVVILMFNARFSGEAPAVFGYQVFRVSSASMEPTLMVGDVILVKQTEPQDINKGDIITYKGEEGSFSGKFITHMVVKQPECVNGEFVFTTKGVSKQSLNIDPLVSEDQVQGVYVCTVPFINAVYDFFLKPYGFMTFILIIVVLFAYELISLIVSYNKLDDDDINKMLKEASDDNETNSSDDVFDENVDSCNDKTNT